ncbi:MAG TPA: hypothetical protein EYP19_17170 [Desulfobacterales bacterium]|nr:hypothetical protein [Desulfobacterales bacterium]
MQRSPFHVKNTKTRLGNTEMAKTLTYFAICNLKSAFGVETSKSFPTHQRAYYHLRILESYMDLYRDRISKGLRAFPTGRQEGNGQRRKAGIL